VAIGRVASPGEEIIDVYGKTVNVAASMPSAGLALTPTAFLSLKPETRRLFKKHTPPISYIDADDRRPEQRRTTVRRRGGVEPPRRRPRSAP
jgi:hypothetical protein